MRFKEFFNDISFKALKQEIATYSLRGFLADLKAGFNIALLTVPQSMACALIAGLPLSAGLFAAIFPPIIAVFMGSSRFLHVGPSSSIALLVQTAISEILFTHFQGAAESEIQVLALEITMQLLMLIVVFQLLAGLFKLGRLVQFVSHSVLIGYVAGVAVSLVANQLFPLLGMNSLGGVTSVYQKIFFIVTHPEKIHIATALVGTITMVTLLILRRQGRKAQGAVLALGAAVLFSYLASGKYAFLKPFTSWIDIGSPIRTVADVGNVQGTVSFLALPWINLSLINDLLPFAFAIALLTILETIAVTKTLSTASGERIWMNQEIVSLGFSNLLSLFVGGMPVSGSHSRSAMGFDLGAKTRFAALIDAFFTIIFVFFLGFLVRKIPLSALAALLIVSVAATLNKNQLKICLKATKQDAFVLWMTFFSCCFLTLDVAFYIGVILSITLYLKKAAAPQLVEFGVDEKGELKSQESGALSVGGRIRVIKVKGELFFGAAELFHTTLRSIADKERDALVIILHLKNARDLDATACLALEQLFDYLNALKKHLIVSGLSAQIWQVLQDSGLIQKIGKENLFGLDDKYTFRSLQLAIERGRALVVKTLEQEEVKPEKVVVAVPLMETVS